MKKIPLTKGKYAVVDNEDYAWVKSVGKWSCHIGSSTSYARREEKGVLVIMHRLIVGAPQGLVVDHIDGNGLNNRRENLGICTNAQNLMNRKNQRNNRSGFKGVSWHKAQGKFRAFIYLKGRHISLGSFSKAKEAAQAYNQASLKYHGKFGRLNKLD